MRERTMKIYKKVFHGMWNADEQQDDIKLWKEQCDIDDENEVKEITAARTPIKRTSLCLWHVIKHSLWKVGWKPCPKVHTEVESFKEDIIVEKEELIVKIPRSQYKSELWKVHWSK